MLHVCDQRFDLTENLEIFFELNKALVSKKFIHPVESLNMYGTLNIDENKN